MRYFPRISPNSLKLSPKLRANVKFQSSTHAYLFIKTKLCLLHSKAHFISFNLIYWTPICGKYSLECTIFFLNVEKYGKTAVFPGGYGQIGEILPGRLWLGL